jgi:hypothetical protein
MIDDRDWQLTIIGVKAYKIAWHKMMTNAGSNKIFENAYTSLSLNTHPSNVSVAQFSSMYQDRTHISNTKTAILLSSIYTAWLIRDYVTYFQSCQEIFNKMPMMSQMLINSYNSAYRGDEFLLNDILNVLN